MRGSKHVRRPLCDCYIDISCLQSCAARSCPSACQTSTTFHRTFTMSSAVLPFGASTISTHYFLTYVILLFCYHNTVFYQFYTNCHKHLWLISLCFSITVLVIFHYFSFWSWLIDWLIDWCSVIKFNTDLQLGYQQDYWLIIYFSLIVYYYYFRLYSCCY